MENCWTNHWWKPDPAGNFLRVGLEGALEYLKGEKVGD